MEYIPFFNIIMAFLIASIIIVISILKNPVVKAIVYGLPIPITLALIATQKTVNGSHILGLFLLTGFLWIILFIKERCGFNIVLIDIVSSILYVGLGYLFVILFPVQDHLFVLLFLYILFWFIFITFFRKKESREEVERKKINPIIKGTFIFVISLLLLSAKDSLEGVVVTFPFSGVFAVIEMRDSLDVLAAEFTKNSLAILVFFCVIFLLFPFIGMYLSIFVGWIFYSFELYLIQKNFN
jgi:hypothetical protein